MTNWLSPNPFRPDLDDFELAYFEAALWSTSDADTEEHLDKCYGISDLRRLMPEWFAQQRRDIASFRRDNWQLLGFAKAKYGATDEQHGHDFWLTREGHGAGFWDRGYGDVGEQLAKATEPYRTGAGDSIAIELDCPEGEL